MKATYTTDQSVSLGADQSPYVRLYQAVIFRAVQDLARKQHRAKARRWLLSPESDYAFVTAGINPDAIRRPMTRLTKTKKLNQEFFPNHHEFASTRIGAH